MHRDTCHSRPSAICHLPSASSTFDASELQAPRALLGLNNQSARGTFKLRGPELLSFNEAEHLCDAGTTLRPSYEHKMSDSRLSSGSFLELFCSIIVRDCHLQTPTLMHTL